MCRRHLINVEPVLNKNLMKISKTNRVAFVNTYHTSSGNPHLSSSSSKKVHTKHSMIYVFNNP